MIPGLQPWSLSSKNLADEVYVELVDILFTARLPVIIIGITVLALGGMIAARRNDDAVFALTVACVLTTVVRILLIHAYRRRRANQPLSREAARVWERRYAGGSMVLAALIGAMGARAVSMGDPLVSMMILGLLFGYGSGLVTRVSVRPVICFTSQILAAVPIDISLGYCIHRAASLPEWEAYLALMLLVAGFTLSSLETVVHGYQTTLQQLLTNKDLAVLAGQDALTGLPNRLLLRSRFSEAATRIRRAGTLLALHCLDLDRFKSVNDTFGHPTGDALLQAVAKRLARTLQSGDTVARLGGDEFVVVQIGIHHADEARLLAQRIIRVLSTPYDLDGQIVKVGASIGIALCSSDESDLEQVLARADAALYRAKRSACGGAEFWSEALATAVSTTSAATGEWKA